MVFLEPDNLFRGGIEGPGPGQLAMPLRFGDIPGNPKQTAEPRGAASREAQVSAVLTREGWGERQDDRTGGKGRTGHDTTVTTNVFRFICYTVYHFDIK